jgi:hypothetical protein
MAGGENIDDMEITGAESVSATQEVFFTSGLFEE